MARLQESDQLPAEAQGLKESIEKDSARFPRKQCAKCEEDCFRQHQKRGRWFQAVVSGMVHAMLCLVCRWKCVNCGTTFTQLPAVCVPFKRYLRSEIEKRAKAYVEEAMSSYRTVVKERGAAVVYDDAVADAQAPEAQKEAEAVRALAPSTPHRWIGHIAACREQWQPAIRQAQQLEPERGLGAIVIAAGKYRSEARKRILEACGLLLRALTRVQRNTTELATLGSSP